MSSYTYPDPDDATTFGFIQKEESWEQDEKDVLSQALRFVQSGGVLVDAGCGFGRLIPVFAPHCAKIIAIEPDSDRIEKARQTVEYAKLSEKVEFVNLPLEEVVLPQPADVVLSSHIIQHVSTSIVQLIIHSMAQMLATDGLLILATNTSPNETDRFTKGYLQNGENIEDEITQSEFEQLIGNTEGVVPVHMYSEDTIGLLLETAGFTILEEHFFHRGVGYPKGRDVLVIAKKR